MLATSQLFYPVDEITYLCVVDISPCQAEGCSGVCLEEHSYETFRLPCVHIVLHFMSFHACNIPCTVCTMVPLILLEGHCRMHSWCYIVDLVVESNRERESIH